MGLGATGAGLGATALIGAGATGVAYGTGVVLGPKLGADGPPRYGVGVGLGATALVGVVVGAGVGEATPPIPDRYCAIRLCNSAGLIPNPPNPMFPNPIFIVLPN